MVDSDYIIYVNESGDQSLVSINSQYPAFVLACAVIHKNRYLTMVSDLLSLKFYTFGHDQIVIHEREIRKRLNDFAFLHNPSRALQFLTDITMFVQNAQFTLIAAVVHKTRLVVQYRFPEDPYAIALLFCLERAFGFLKDCGQEERRTFFIVESRGRKEDRDLELTFRRICAGANMWKCTLPFEVKFSHKQCNSTGMQLADLIARPSAKKY